MLEPTYTASHEAGVVYGAMLAEWLARILEDLEDDEVISRLVELPIPTTMKVCLAMRLLSNDADAFALLEPIVLQSPKKSLVRFFFTQWCQLSSNDIETAIQTVLDGGAVVPPRFYR